MPRRDPGQPPFEPTPEQRKLVQVLAANGTSQATIARNVGPRGIDEKTLRKHFRRELSDGHEQIKAAIGLSVVRAALNGNVYAAKYWLSTHGGPEWRVVEGRTLGGMDNTPPIAVKGDARVIIFSPDDDQDR
jgi:hypothetical protein